MRLYKYDFVRAVAIMFVVAVHSLYFVNSVHEQCAYPFYALQTIFFTGNVLFFLLSGKFNLREKKDDAAVKKFYYNKIRNIVVPIVIFFFIRTLYDLYPDYSLGLVVKTFIKNFVYDYSHIEYWFMYTLVGFLLVAPFLSHAFARFSKFEKKLFVGIGLGYHLVLLIVSDAGYPLGWSYLFFGFSFTFFIGGLIEDLFETKKSRCGLALTSVLCLLATMVLFHFDKTGGLQESSPFYTGLAIGIYIGLLQLGEKMKPSRAVSFIAKHSFSIYLVHMMILIPLHSVIPVMEGPISFLGFLGAFAIAFSLSLLLAFVLDKCVVDPAELLFDKLFKRLLEKRKNTV